MINERIYLRLKQRKFLEFIKTCKLNELSDTVKEYLDCTLVTSYYHENAASQLILNQLRKFYINDYMDYYKNGRNTI